MLQGLVAGRIREITDMRWSELHPSVNEWALPPELSKNKQRHVVLLSEPAAEILERRKRWRSEVDEFVFPAPNDRRRTARSDLVQKALEENREALGVTAGWTSHSVRHSFTTVAAERGHPVQVVDRCTNHKIAAGTINANYNHATLNEPARQLWAECAEYLAKG
jgi:integrase